MGSVTKSYFKASDSTDVVPIAGVPTEVLNADDNLINAVYVKVRRETFSIVMFFAGIFNIDFFPMSARAVAYLGYAGSLEPQDVDLPIAICRESIIECPDPNDPEKCFYDCNIGRMINSGSNVETHNTAAWTNYLQPDPPGEKCSSANSNELKDILDGCQAGNDAALIFGNTMGMLGGQATVVLEDLTDCWIAGKNDIVCNEDGETKEVPIDTDSDDIPDTPWEVTLPVISCPGNNIANCSWLKGAVTVKLMWMPPKGNIDWAEAPSKMYLDLPTLANCESAVPEYGPIWPDDVKDSNNTNILDIPINQAFMDGESLLDVMMEAFNENDWDKVNRNLEKYYPGWQSKTLGELFYDPNGEIINTNAGEGAVRWASFVKTFVMKNVDDKYAPYQDAGIYFLPSCEMHEPIGDSGGENFGIIADKPVLVYHELLHDVELLTS